jgi:transcriptional regulator with XRE-family HTH domain
MEWWERLRGWTDDKGWKVPELARRSGVNKETIYKWLAGGVANPRGGDLDRVLNCLDKSDLELFYGLSEARLTQLKEIPLLNILNLGKLKRGQAARDAWDGVSTTTVGADVSADALGVVLDDESCAPEFHARETVIIEPDKPLIPGKFVVAVLEGDQHAVFRRYRPSGMSQAPPFKLVATNPDFPEIEVTEANPGFVIARATKHIRDI